MKGNNGACEWLMIYGWGIMIILIVAGVLVYYGIFGFLKENPKEVCDLLENETLHRECNYIGGYECRCYDNCFQLGGWEFCKKTYYNFTKIKCECD